MKKKLAEQIKTVVEMLVRERLNGLSSQEIYADCVDVILHFVFFRCAKQRDMTVASGFDDQTSMLEILVSSGMPLDLEFLGQVYETLQEYTLAEQDGELIVTPSQSRRKRGAHYTPRSLADEIVREAFAEYRPKRPEEILALKICDPAMGGGAFLVAVCRLLAERLRESWEMCNENSPPTEHEAARLVAEHCLYGVDSDPRAVKIARLSLCLLTHSMELPEANFRCGDSLTLQWSDEFPDVFSRDNPGFDAVIGNPPFMGGRKIRSELGEPRLRRLKVEWPHASWNADLCAFFFLRAATIVRSGGTIGFIATKTIAHGDTARTGLLHLVRTGFCVRQAVSSFPWPGQATVNAAWVVLQHGTWNGPRILDGRHVDVISPTLDEGGDWDGATIIPENAAINFQGSVLAGEGFVLSLDEAEHYLNARQCNAEVLFPYLGGSEVNSSPTFAVRRWVIDFRNRSLEECETRWPELIDRIRRLVKPLRAKTRRSPHRRFWWLHGDKRPALYERIRQNDTVFVLTRHTKHLALAQVSTRQVFQESLCVLDLPGWTAFAAIQSTIHDLWARRGSSTLGSGVRYTPTDYFDTFPFQQLRSDDMERLGKEYYEHRRQTMQELGEGFTKIYNRFHAPSDKNDRIEKLRDLRRRMDEAVATAYGWNDLDLNHEFRGRATGGVRWTIDDKIRYEILRRLRRSTG